MSLTKVLIIFFALGLVLEAAQASETIFKLKWACPQQKYAGLTQLPEKAKLKVTIEEKNGELYVTHHPKIFSESITSGSVDVSDCVTRLREDLKIQLRNYHTKDCEENTEAAVCWRSLAEIETVFDRNLKNEAYFRTAEALSYPRILPGEINTFMSADDAGQVLDQFCKDSKPNAKLFSGNVLIALETRSSDSQLSPKLGCLKALRSALAAYKERSAKELCEQDSKACKLLEAEVSRLDTQLGEHEQQKIAHLAQTDSVWRESLKLPTETEELRQKLFQRLEQDPLECHSLIDPIKKDEQLLPVAHLTKLVAEFATKASEQSDARCMRKLAQSYAYHLGYLPWERADFLEYCRGDETPLCQEAKEQSSRHKQNLLNIIAMSDGDHGKGLVDDSRDCKRSPLSQFQGLYEWLKQKREALNCIDLKPGETKVIAYQDGQPSGLGGDYSLTKRPDGDFEVGIAMEVRDQDPERRNEMQARIKSCIAGANGFFKGPNNEKLRINIMTRGEARQLPVHLRPGLNRISIQPENARSNSTAYAANIDCATIVHEVLHLTGLCDEYNGNEDGHSCRAVVRKPSIMSDNRKAYELAMPTNLRCECLSAACTDALSSANMSKRDFYLKKKIYSMTESQFRMNHCIEKTLPTILWIEGQELEATSLTTETPLQVVALSQDFIDRKNVVHRRELRCSCQPQDQACAEGLRSFTQQIKEQKDQMNPGCPYGSRSLREKGPQKWDGRFFGITIPPELPSLLHPNQFQRITGGACAARAQSYNQCAVWAYKSKEQTNNCEGRPDFCDDERVFLGVQR